MNVRVSEDNSLAPQALSNDVCNAIVDNAITKPCPPKLPLLKHNTNKNEARGNFVISIYTVQTLIGNSSFSE